MNNYTSRTHHIACHWEGVLEQLKAFEELSQEKETAALDTFYALHDALVSITSKASCRDAKKCVGSAAVDAAFIESVWLSLEQYPALVHHPDIENLDTAGSKIFTRFAPDAPTTPAEKEKLMHRVQHVFGIDADARARVTGQLSRRAAPLTYRHRIMRSLEARFELVSDAPDLDTAVLRFFRCLYPDAPFKAGEVKCVKTASALYFCLPTVKEASEPVASTRFLQRIWQVEPFAHFPVFSTFDAEKVDCALLQQLAEDTGLSVELTTTTLTRMIGFLPLDELDQFLIHDTWGHQWQESLLDFEEPYRELADFHRPLSLTESASVLGEHTTFAAAFVTTDAGEVRLNPTKLRQFIDAEFYERSIIAFTPIVAELLADAVEYKFLMQYPEQAHLLPSSSLLKHFPSKLDLTLADLRKCFAHAAEVFRTWVGSEETRHCLKQDLERQLQKPVDSAVLEEAVQRCKAQLERHYQPEWAWEKTTDGHLKLNAFSLAALNFLRIHTALLHTYGTLAQLETGPAFSDTLVLAMGTFFQKEPQKHLWQLDSFLTEGFLPRWQKCFAHEQYHGD